VPCCVRGLWFMPGPDIAHNPRTAVVFFSALLSPVSNSPQGRYDRNGSIARLFLIAGVESRCLEKKILEGDYRRLSLKPQYRRCRLQRSKGGC
jgi:hypothetical protein